MDAKVEIDTSPTPGDAWDGWRPVAPGTHRYWQTRLRFTVTGDGRRFMRAPRLVVTRRKFNRKREGHVGGGPDDPVVVTFPVPFQNAPKVTAHLLGYPGSVEIVAVTATQVTLRPGAAVCCPPGARYCWVLPTVRRSPRRTAMLSDEWTEWHLTPRGWKEGSTKMDFVGRTDVPRPPDAVLTVTYRERVASVASRRGERGHTENWRGDDAARLSQLLAHFGPCPASL